MKLGDKDIKLHRIREYINQYGYTGMVLSRQDNFNWITGGGNSRVVVPKEEGFGTIVVTPESVFMVAQVMDGSRIMDEELHDLEAEYIPLRWYEESVNERAVKLAGERPVSDVNIAGSEYKLKDIYHLHFPLTEQEIERLKRLGEKSDYIINKVAKEIKPGMVDYEAEAMLLYEYAKENIQCDVLLIGTDERIYKYRHPSPVGRRLGNYVFLHPAVRSGGLHCNITRSIYFGDTLPSDIDRAYSAVSQIEAYCMSMCRTGNRWSDILEGQKRLLKELDFEEEWKGHYPGGRTGYFVCQADLSLNRENRISNNEAYDWFITVTGAKVEELSINHNGSLSICSHTGLWPSKKISIDDTTLDIPQIMMR
jgi:Xaa-Pro dipeptidase